MVKLCPQTAGQDKQPQVAAQEIQVGYWGKFLTESAVRPLHRSYSGQWWNPHPQRDLTALWMRHLWIWISGGLGSAGKQLDLVVSESISSQNDSVTIP